MQKFYLGLIKDKSFSIYDSCIADFHDEKRNFISELETKYSISKSKLSLNKEYFWDR